MFLARCITLTAVAWLLPLLWTFISETLNSSWLITDTGMIIVTAYLIVRLVNWLLIASAAVAIIFLVCRKPEFISAKKFLTFFERYLFGEEVAVGMLDKIQRASVLDKWSRKLDTAKECPICLLTIQVGEIGIIMPCSGLHVYHRSCAEMLFQQEGESRCALCRAPLKV